MQGFFGKHLVGSTPPPHQSAACRAQGEHRIGIFMVFASPPNMFVLFDFLFECARIILLAFVYGTLLWVIIRIIRGKKFDRLREYLGLLVGVFLLLIINRNMPWRDEGSGDFCKAPLPGRYKLSIGDCSDSEAMIEKRDEHGGTSVTALYVQGDTLFARLNDPFGTDSMEYAIIVITTGKVNKFKDNAAFKKVGGESSRLKKPMELFDATWSKWRILY